MAIGSPPYLHATTDSFDFRLGSFRGPVLVERVQNDCRQQSCADREGQQSALEAAEWA